MLLPENPRDGGAWWAAIHGVAQSRTRLSDSAAAAAAAQMKAHAPCLLTFRYKGLSWQLLCEIHSVFLPSQACLHNDLEGPFSFACHRLVGSFVLEQGGSMGELVWPSAQSTPHCFSTPSCLVHRLHVHICQQPKKNQGFGRTSPYSFSLTTSGT